MGLFEGFVLPVLCVCLPEAPTFECNHYSEPVSINLGESPALEQPQQGDPQDTSVPDARPLMVTHTTISLPEAPGPQPDSQH